MYNSCRLACFKTPPSTFDLFTLGSSRTRSATYSTVYTTQLSSIQLNSRVGLCSLARELKCITITADFGRSNPNVSIQIKANRQTTISTIALYTRPISIHSHTHSLSPTNCPSLNLSPPSRNWSLLPLFCYYHLRPYFYPTHPQLSCKEDQ